ncbi:unnamed protein product [Trichogramma brassicae]|uniref:Carboxypeptidase n=1 Tax=Trichogramma brassicae TaxID=86971 RepID=A0A6H5I1P3_9HYME|nr:unnamed protein product [Trichogramma brassicae]
MMNRSVAAALLALLARIGKSSSGLPSSFPFANSSRAAVSGRKGFGPGEQDWAYVQLRQGAHMFWWLFYAGGSEANDRPLVVWLQGGPGASSSAIGNFGEIGPIDAQLRARNHTWVKDYNVLFIDNPVGTGFSYVDDYERLANDNSQIARDLVSCIEAFYRRMTAFAATPAYLIAQSYGGKMGVEFANHWYRRQAQGLIRSNLRGIGLIDSSISAIDNYRFFASYLLHTGFVDMIGFRRVDLVAEKLEQAAAAGHWPRVVDITQQIEALVVNITDNMDWYNILNKVDTCSSKALSDKYVDLMNGPVRSSLNLTSYWGHQSYRVALALLEDNMKPVIDQVEMLLNSTELKVHVCTGQLDFIINTPGTLKWIEKMKGWKDLDEWIKAPRLPLVIDNVVEGYSKSYDRFKLFWVNRAGHAVRQPESAIELAFTIFRLV